MPDQSHVRSLVIELNTEAHQNYILLTRSARRQVLISRTLHVSSGILALLSGSAITAVAAKVLSPDVWQVVSAATAFLSGVSTLLVSGFFSDKDSQAMLQLAGKFLSLREEGSIIIQRPGQSEQAVFKDFERLSEGYQRVSRDAARFIPVKEGAILPPRA
jgi:hypothetical protein